MPSRQNGELSRGRSHEPENFKSGVTIAHLNINFLYNKFEGLKLLVQDKIDILVLSETKLDDTYTTNQFMIEGFSSPFRADKCPWRRFIYLCKGGYSL